MQFLHSLVVFWELQVRSSHVLDYFKGVHAMHNDCMHVITGYQALSTSSCSWSAFRSVLLVHGMDSVGVSEASSIKHSEFILIMMFDNFVLVCETTWGVPNGMQTASVAGSHVSGMPQSISSPFLALRMTL
jgi:hypothetical protein